MITVNIDSVIRSWLDSCPEDKDPAQGALLLLRIDRNQVFYRAALANPARYMPRIEERLRAHLARRQAIPTVEQARSLAADAEKIMYPASEIKKIKGGKRPDHDSLPPEVRQLYVDNAELRRRMQQYHLRIRTLIGGKQECSREEIKELVDLLRRTDKQYLDNWKKYDSYPKAGLADP